MTPYRALNYWVVGGFDGAVSAYEAIDFAAAEQLDGMELTFGDCLPVDVSDAACAKIRAYAAAKGVGLRTLATGHYWQESLGAIDADERRHAIAFTQRYIEVAALLGAETVLVVPGAVDVAWDPSRPVLPYADVWRHATDSLRTLLPIAETHNVNIALENVWNKFLLSPMEFKFFLDQFNSSRIGIYLDLGNAILNGYPQHWIDILNNKIFAIHLKNFSRQDCGGLIGGFGDDLTHGDVDFNAVFHALKSISYQGPLTVEMIPFSRLPNLNLPDPKLARDTAQKLHTLTTNTNN